MWRAGGRYPVALVAALVARMGWPRWPVAGGAGRVAAGRVGWWRRWWPLVAPVAGGRGRRCPLAGGWPVAGAGGWRCALAGAGGRWGCWRRAGGALSRRWRCGTVAAPRP